jgi:uncharacterized protein (TIGR03083 family)
VDHATYLAHVQADTDLLLATAAGALDRSVPTCPRWTVERLVGHVGRVHRWTAGWVATGGSTEIERPPPGDPVVDWTRAGTDELLAALEARGDTEAPVDTWAGRQPASFWPRRMAIETAVHRCDAQVAVAGLTPVDTALAVDGIDELFAVILPWRGTGDLGGVGETIHLHATDPDLGTDRGGTDRGGTDRGGEWLVTLTAAGPEVENVHAKGDVAVRGTASDLLLLLYSRVGPERCEVFGDAALLDRWRDAVDI